MSIPAVLSFWSHACIIGLACPLPDAVVRSRVIMHRVGRLEIKISYLVNALFFIVHDFAATLQAYFYTRGWFWQRITCVD